MIQFLVMKSAGAGIGAFIGALIGLSVSRKRNPQTRLLGGSVLLTSAAAGLAALATMMVITYLRMA